MAGALLATLSIGSAALAHAAAATPQAYALKAADLGTSFGVASAKVVNNATFARTLGIPAGQLTQHGRITGYQIEYEQHTTSSIAFSYIYTYKSAAGAHWDYGVSTQYDLRVGGKRIAAPKVGDESVALYAQQGTGKTIAAFYDIHFRRGPVDNSVGVGGLKGTVTLAQAVHYAKIVAAREPKS
jgi:hypothetical protein